MKNKRHTLWVLAITCARLVLGGWSVTSSWGAEGAVSPTASFPEVSIIKDRCFSEVFLRFSPDGRELARLPQFGQVHLSDTASYKKVRTFKVGMRMVAYSPDGTKMATAEGTDGARIWDAAAQGTRISEAKSTEVYALETPLKVLEAPSADRTQRVFWTEFSPDGTRLITTQANGHVKVWNTSSWVMEDDLALTDSEVRAAAFSPDSKSLVIGDVKGALHHWSLERKTAITSTVTGHHSFGPVLGLVIAPNGKTLITSHQSAVMIWNTSTGVAQGKHGFSCAAISMEHRRRSVGESHRKR